MKIFEITRPVEINHADAILRRSGYQDLQHQAGHTSGTFARVFTKPGKDYVLKLFGMEDYAYRRYLSLITSVRNPHFPVVRGKPIRVSNFYYAVRLELLAPLDMSRNSERIVMDRYLETLQDVFEKNTASYEPEIQKYADKLAPETKQALDLIYDYCIKGYPKTIVDIHRHNVMMRGDTLVIIDPVAYGNETSSTPRHSPFDKFPSYPNRENRPPPMPYWLQPKTWERNKNI